MLWAAADAVVEDFTGEASEIEDEELKEDGEASNFGGMMA